MPKLRSDSSTFLMLGASVLTMVRLVTLGSMLHTLERHFLTTKPFLFQNLLKEYFPSKKFGVF